MKKTIEQIKQECLEAGIPLAHIELTPIPMDPFFRVDATFERDLSQEEWNAFENIRDDANYREKRAKEYPPLTDFADALYWQQRGDESKMEAYLAACDAVKDKFPKP